MKHLHRITGIHDAGSVWSRIIELIDLAATIHMAGGKEVQRSVYEAECQAAISKGRAATVVELCAVIIGAGIVGWREIEASGILEISLGQKRLV